MTLDTDRDIHSVGKAWVIYGPDSVETAASLRALQPEAEAERIGAVILVLEGIQNLRSEVDRWAVRPDGGWCALVVTPASAPGRNFPELLSVDVQVNVWPMHTMDLEMHDRLVGTPGSARETLAGLDAHIANGCFESKRVYIRTLVTADTYETLPDLGAFLRGLGVAGWIWELPNNAPLLLMTETQQRKFDEIGQRALALGPPALLPSSADAGPSHRVFGHDGNALAASSIGIYPALIGCRIHESVTTVDLFRGRLVTCPFSGGDAPSVRFVPGSVSLSSAWNAHTFQKRRSAWCADSKSNCTKCQPIARYACKTFPSDRCRSGGVASGTGDYCFSPISGGGIILNWACNAGCAHCLFACDAATRMPMAPGLIVELLRSIEPYLEGPRGLHVSGGEPFLDVSHLEKVVGAFVSEAIRLEFVESNGFWGSNPRQAREALVTLREAGLRRLRLSVSPFHMPHIPLDVSRAAYEFACAVLGESNVFVFDKSLWLRAVNEAVPFDLCSGGRAGYMAARYGIRTRPASEYTQSCGTSLFHSGHAHFDGEGYIIPGVCTGIRIGRYTDLPQLSAGMDVERFPVLKCLASSGPAALWRYAREEFGIDEPAGGFVGPCHCCVEVRRRLFACKRFPELGPVVFYQALNRFHSAAVDNLAWDHASSLVW